MTSAGRRARRGRRDRGSTAASRSASLVVGLLAVSVLGACSSDDGTDATDAVPAGTVDVATLPPVATTVPPVQPAVSEATTQPPPTTAMPSLPAPATTVTNTVTNTDITSTSVVGAATSTTARVTTTVAADEPPCRLDLIVDQTQTMYEGITPSDLNCVDGWAAWIGRPDDQLADGFFAVARWTGSAWELANLGTAGVCADAGVPDDLFDPLGCFE